MSVGRGAPVLAACGLALTGCVGIWAAQGDQTRRAGSHLLLYAVAFAAYLVALRASRGVSRRGLALALGLAAAWRLVLVPVEPLLSDDVHRYVWEGRIQGHGGNPYAWADRPEAEKWSALRDPVWDRINHKDYTAIYPPLWQLVARAVVAVRDSVATMKAFLVLCELLTLVALARLLARRGLPPERLLVFAWSPLALVEIAGTGHNEAFGMLMLAVALLALESGRPLLSALAAAAGFQAKLLPGLAAAAWARRFRWGHVAAAVALAAAVVVPYRAAGAGLLRSLGKYADFWRFNETFFAALAAVVGEAGALRLGAALVVGLALWLAWRRTEPASAALAVVAAALLLSANVLPWYALWLLPLLVLRDSPPALVFTGTVGLAYLVYPAWLAGGPWHVGWDVRALEYGPCVLAASWAARPRARG